MLPEDFKNKYNRILGDEYEDFLLSFDEPVQKAYRVNPLKPYPVISDTEDHGNLPYGKWGHFGAVNGHSVDHVTGVVYSQEPSAQFVGEVVRPNPGERVLDLAAAPGGKSTHLAAFMGQKGLLWSNEIFLNRAKILSENIERMGIKNAIVSSHTPAELSSKLPGFFDKILLDAPCSGEGMFRKDPGAIAYWHEHYPAENATRQREILTEAVKMLRPGGQIVYSTCTFAPEEDEQIINWLMAAYPEFSLVSIEKPDGANLSDARPEWIDEAFVNGTNEHSATTTKDVMKKAARLWPHKLEGEGHFVAKLVKANGDYDDVSVVKPLKNKPLDKQQREILSNFFEEALITFDQKANEYVLFGDHLYMAPIGTPDISSMKILRLGLELGLFKKKRFEPAHALALALNPDEVKQSYEMNPEEWAQFVHGDVIQTRLDLDKGWVLMTANGNGAGWGRYVNGQIKNFFPKGLRFVVKK